MHQIRIIQNRSIPEILKIPEYLEDFKPLPILEKEEMEKQAELAEKKKQAIENVEQGSEKKK